MVEAVVALRPAKVIVDATFGAGGYSAAFIAAGAAVIAFDRDPAAEAFAGPMIAAGGPTLVGDCFSTIADHLTVPLRRHRFRSWRLVHAAG